MINKLIWKHNKHRCIAIKFPNEKNFAFVFENQDWDALGDISWNRLFTLPSTESPDQVKNLFYEVIASTLLKGANFAAESS